MRVKRVKPLFVFSGVSFLLAFLASESLATSFVSRERHWAVTEKKFEIALQRFRLNEGAQHPAPVILIPGLLVNSHFLDMGHDQSLAQYLAEAGFDVWNVSLRGTGRSLNPLGWGDKPWNLDDMISDDLPALVDYILRESRQPRALIVGYELGGLLAFGYLVKNPQAPVAGLVALAAPIIFDSPEQEPLQTLLDLESYPRLKKFLLYLNVPLLGKLAIPLSPKLQKVFYNPEHMEQQVVQEMLETSLVKINPGVLTHLAKMIRQGEFVSTKDDFNYRKALSRLSVPLLLIGGAADPIAPPAVLRKTYSEIASEDRELMIFWSGSDDDDTPYGHFDLVLGKGAKDVVFPLIKDWLQAKTPTK